VCIILYLLTILLCFNRKEYTLMSQRRIYIYLCYKEELLVVFVTSFDYKWPQLLLHLALVYRLESITLESCMCIHNYT